MSNIPRLKNFLIVMVVAPVLLGTSGVFADQTTASNNQTVTFACSDNSRDITVGDNKKPPKTKYIKCKNGAKIDYTNYGSNTNETTLISVAFSCPANLVAAFYSQIPNAASDALNLFCQKPGAHNASGSQALPKFSKSSVQQKVDIATGGVTQSGVDSAGLPPVNADNTTIKTLLDIFFGIVGAIAVVLVSIGGLRYVLASGDPSQITQAKNTILYALIGLVIALTGFSIVTFLINSLK